MVHTADLNVLLLERADFRDHWQSVTGSQEAGESLLDTARRELLEETGIDPDSRQLIDWSSSNQYEIFPQWWQRYRPGTTHNVEHVFSIETPPDIAVTLSPREHLQYIWLPVRQAAEKVFSWTNRDAILKLPELRRAGRIP